MEEGYHEIKIKSYNIFVFTSEKLGTSPVIKEYPLAMQCKPQFMMPLWVFVSWYVCINQVVLSIENSAWEDILPHTRSLNLTFQQAIVRLKNGSRR
jgi:hypothetical protein